MIPQAFTFLLHILSKAASDTVEYYLSKAIKLYNIFCLPESRRTTSSVLQIFELKAFTEYYNIPLTEEEFYFTSHNSYNSYPNLKPGTRDFYYEKTWLWLRVRFRLAILRFIKTKYGTFFRLINSFLYFFLWLFILFRHTSLI